MPNKIEKRYNNRGNKIIDSPKPVIVLFTAEWCVPCNHLKPYFKKAIEENPLGCFVEIDIFDDEKREVVERYKINALPTIKIFKNAKVMHTFAGRNECNKQTLNDIVSKALQLGV